MISALALHGRTCLAVGLVLGLFASPAPAAQPAASAAVPVEAEFAVRWDVKEGGPASAKAAYDVLGLKKKPEEDTYQIRYFTAGKPPEAPAGFDTILRERIKNKKKVELTYKLRSVNPLPQGAPKLDDWQCPLGGTRRKDKKDEVDVSFLEKAPPKTVYSRSCEIGDDAALKGFPETWKATAKGCSATMTRLSAEGFKIEQWRLSSDVTLIEVSANGKATQKEAEAFRATVVARLIEAGAKPVDRSKSEAGSDCGKPR